MILKVFKKDKDKRAIYKCDSCGDEYEVSWYYLNNKGRLETQLCRKCTIKENNTVEKRKATCLEKYGHENPMQVAEYKDKFVSANKDTYKNQRVDLEEIKKVYESEGYTLLETEYKNNTHKMKCICPNGHEFLTTWNMWTQGKRCRTCSLDEHRYSFDFVKQQFEFEGYKLLDTEYKNNQQLLTYKCPNDHIGKIRLHHWIQHGHRCAACSRIKSRSETEIFDFVKQYFPNSENGSRSTIPPYELDIIIPEKKIAIEYCGLFWHSETMKKDNNYHLTKLDLCNEIGYNLITIFEDEWITKQEIVKSRLKNILGINNSNRVYARNCVIKEIDTKIKDKFLEKNHLQGKDVSSTRLGAFFNDELVSVMTFSRGSIAKGIHSQDKNTFELNRFCSNYNYSVVGIASKLLKYFITNYNPSEIYSYADRRWSTGNLYEKLGFEFSHFTQPNYWYIDRNIRIHRFNFRKSVLKDKLDNFNPELTEYENMLNSGYHRIWDCGSIKYKNRIGN